MGVPLAHKDHISAVVPLALRTMIDIDHPTINHLRSLFVLGRPAHTFTACSTVFARSCTFVRFIFLHPCNEDLPNTKTSIAWVSGLDLLADRSKSCRILHKLLPCYSNSSAAGIYGDD